MVNGLDLAKRFAAIRFQHFSRDLTVVALALTFVKFCSKTEMDSKYFECFPDMLVR